MAWTVLLKTEGHFILFFTLVVVEREMTFSAHASVEQQTSVAWATLCWKHASMVALIIDSSSLTSTPSPLLILQAGCLLIHRGILHKTPKFIEDCLETFTRKIEWKLLKDCLEGDFMGLWANIKPWGTVALNVFFWIMRYCHATGMINKWNDVQQSCLSSGHGEKKLVYETMRKTG